jgi:hypothetical protein
MRRGRVPRGGVADGCVAVLAGGTSISPSNRAVSQTSLVQNIDQFSRGLSVPLVTLRKVAVATDFDLHGPCCL